MATETINAALLQKMFLAGARRIEAKKEWINELNVFPVPDGDTGTNMSMTIMAAAREVEQIAAPTMDNLAKAMSMGALRGARGNSGVILSQLFRGFSKEIKEIEEINLVTLAAALERATETAYKAVMKPKEGTILTVAKGIAQKAAEEAMESDSLEKSMIRILEYGNEVLQKTPEMLPVLKQAGVVDSGGQGLIEVLSGALDCFLGKEEVIIEVKTTASTPKISVDVENIDTSDIKFGYCTEFIIMLEKEFTDDDEVEFKAFLESIGDSIVCVHLDEIVKIHVHTNDPGLAIQKALTFGGLTSMKIDNMRIEHHERLIKDAEKVAMDQKAKDQAQAVIEAEKKAAEPRKEVGFVTVSIGEGMNEIFEGLGADAIITGGQTMNPSTEDILNAIDSVNADTIYVLPNNKNIILAAEQAKLLVEDKEIVVVPTKTIPQGIAAMINYVAGESAEENMAHLPDDILMVKSGELTYAVRDTEIDDKVIKSGNIMGIGDAGILAVGQDLVETGVEMIAAMEADDAELISIYYGAEVTEEDAQNFADVIADKYPDCDVELQFGGQPVYYYIVSVE